MKRRFPLHVHISTLFLILILLVSAVISILGFKASRDILETMAVDMNRHIERETLNEYNKIIAPAQMSVRLLSRDHLVDAQTLEERLARLPFMFDLLSSSAALSALYIGYRNGDFFLVRRIASDSERNIFNAPPETAFLVQSIDRLDGNPRGHFIYLDATMKTLRSEDRPDYARSFDPRRRPWHQSALQTEGQVTTAPYLFFSNRKVGTTIATRAEGEQSGTVAGADILLETLGDSLAEQKVTPGTYVLLADAASRVVAFEDFDRAVRFPNGPDANPVLARLDELGIPVLAKLAASAALPADHAQSLTLTDGNGGKDQGKSWHVSVLPVAQKGSDPLYLISAIPDEELMASAYLLMHRSAIITLIVILLAIPITWLLARAISRPLRRLATEAESIRRFEFSEPIEVRSMILEVNDLAETMDDMKHTIRRFLDVSIAIAAENDFDRLLPRLLTETFPAAQAEAGLLYLIDREELTLATALKADGSPLTVNARKIALSAAGPALGAAFQAGKTMGSQLTHDDVSALGLDPIIKEIAIDQAIAVPLLNHQRQQVGAMLLLGRDKADAARLSFIEAISGSAAVSLENKELIKMQKQLFEAFIQLIASAIDAKSPYTGGHCARVPVLTKMLARAACDTESGPYASFRLDEDEWEAVHIASWLHDCGKVTTPEYIVDKATKLETLYDRIHEVRMRFEVLKRDAEIACLKAIAADRPEVEARAALDQALRQLDDDYVFIAECNEGGEYMAPEKVERLRQIAGKTWVRTLDDRIGLSHEEKQRKALTPAPVLPVQETLLADKPEHVFERHGRDRMPPDNPWGFRMPVPERLYNKGEIYNLAVSRGTLSEEERYKINEHIVQTIIMLSQLPFPKHLRKVPEIAGGHHEKMDGTGYPKRLTREEMSPLARMMAIADIFEALTAIDRPYKKGKTLSESIKIMARMKKEQHIDPELFDLFLRSGTHLEYARRHMQPEQIDDVNIALYLDTATETKAA